METKTSGNISWECPEFVHHHKTIWWYLAFAVIAVGLLIFGFFSNSLITIITLGLIVVFGFLYSIESRESSITN